MGGSQLALASMLIFKGLRTFTQNLCADLLCCGLLAGHLFCQALAHLHVLPCTSHTLSQRKLKLSLWVRTSGEVAASKAGLCKVICMNRALTH